jgi:hypothetical protein
MAVRMKIGCCILLFVIFLMGGWYFEQYLATKQQQLLQLMQGATPLSSGQPVEESDSLKFHSREYVKIINLNPH